MPWVLCALELFSFHIFSMGEITRNDTREHERAWGCYGLLLLLIFGLFCVVLFCLEVGYINFLHLNEVDSILNSGVFYQLYHSRRQTDRNACMGITVYGHEPWCGSPASCQRRPEVVYALWAKPETERRLGAVFSNHTLTSHPWVFTCSWWNQSGRKEYSEGLLGKAV